MVKMIFFGFWLSLVTAASAYSAVYMGLGKPMPPTPGEFIAGLKYETTRPISVPVISRGSLQGYVVSQYVYTVDAKTLSLLNVPPDAFIVEEAFKHFFNDKDLDFQNLKSFDTATLVTQIRDAVNKRLHGAVIKDLMINDLNFVSRDALRH